MPTSACESITSTPTLITSPNVAQSDLYYNNPTTRLINFNDPYLTPRTDRTIGRSVPWTTPSYHHVQPVFPSTPTGSQWYEGGSLSASPYTPMSAPAVSPANYIAAGFITSQDSMPPASSLTSVRMLSSDTFGRPFCDLSTAAAYRRAELINTFANCGICWPLMPVDQMMSVLPYTVHNPLVKSLDTKLHHLVANIQQYFSARGHRRGDALRFDRLGDRHRQNGFALEPGARGFFRL